MRRTTSRRWPTARARRSPRSPRVWRQGWLPGRGKERRTQQPAERRRPMERPMRRGRRTDLRTVRCTRRARPRPPQGSQGWRGGLRSATLGRARRRGARGRSTRWAASWSRHLTPHLGEARRGAARSGEGSAGPCRSPRCPRWRAAYLWLTSRAISSTTALLSETRVISRSGCRSISASISRASSELWRKNIFFAPISFATWMSRTESP